MAGALEVNVPETTWHDGGQPGIPDISSYSECQEGPSQAYLLEMTCTSSGLGQINVKQYKGSLLLMYRHTFISRDQMGY